jgi:hypothetical protein
VAGEITERVLVNLLETVRALCVDRIYRELGDKHSFQLWRLFPRELANSNLEKVVRFAQYRMKDLVQSPDSILTGPPTAGKTPESKEDLPAPIHGTGNPLQNWSLDDFSLGLRNPEKDRELEL